MSTSGHQGSYQAGDEDDFNSFAAYTNDFNLNPDYDNDRDHDLTGAPGGEVDLTGEMIDFVDILGGIDTSGPHDPVNVGGVPDDRSSMTSGLPGTKSVVNPMGSGYGAAGGGGGGGLGGLGDGFPYSADFGGVGASSSAGNMFSSNQMMPGQGVYQPVQYSQPQQVQQQHGPTSFQAQTQRQGYYNGQGNVMIPAPPPQGSVRPGPPPPASSSILNNNSLLHPPPLSAHSPTPSSTNNSTPSISHRIPALSYSGSISASSPESVGSLVGRVGNGVAPGLGDVSFDLGFGDEGKGMGVEGIDLFGRYVFGQDGSGGNDRAGMDDGMGFDLGYRQVFGQEQVVPVNSGFNGAYHPTATNTNGNGMDEDVFSEDELKRLLGFNQGGFGFDPNGLDMSAGGGAEQTVDWVGLLAGHQAQMQSQSRNIVQDDHVGLAPSDVKVKRESISSDTTNKPAGVTIDDADESAANRSPRQTQHKQPGINLHNKVEKRYRSNVKNALDSLRDAVPRLRQVYGTSLPSELETTDKEDADGLMGGIGAIGKPTKQTIMLGARMYIEHLETKGYVAEVQKQRSDRILQRLLSSRSGDDWVRWEDEQSKVARRAEGDYRATLDRKSVERGVMLAANGDGSHSSSSPNGGQGDDEEDEAPPVRGRPKKRPREVDDDGEEKKPVKRKPTAAAGKGKKTTKKAAVDTAAGAGAAVMYSFGLAYTFFPRASSIFGSSTSQGAHQGSTSTGTGSVILSAPYKAANHSTHLLKRALPERHHDFWVLKPDDFLDWVGLIFLAGLLSWLTWRLVEVFGLRNSSILEADLNEQEEEEEEQLESIAISIKHGRMGTVAEGFRSVASRFGRQSRSEDAKTEKAWLKVTKAFVGGSELLPNCSTGTSVLIPILFPGLTLDAWTRARVRWRMARKSNNEPMYALLHALHTQDSTHWQKARKLSLDSRDRTVTDVVQLPGSEVRALSRRLGPSDDPVQAIAEFLIVTHLDDLATRLYISLVDASVAPNLVTRNRLASLASPAYKEQIFEALHGIAKHSSAYALGLVLIALWSALNGKDTGIQRSIANLLIARQLKRSDSLASVDVLLGQVVPGYHAPQLRASKPSNMRKPALGVEALDVLLEVCLRYVSLIKRVSKEDQPSRSGLYAETLHIRRLVSRPSFQRTFANISSHKKKAGSSQSDTSSSDSDSVTDSEDVSAIEAEVEAFDRQTDKLIDALVAIGHSSKAIS